MERTKTNEDIIDNLLSDTRTNKIIWFSDDDIFYTKINVKDDINIIFKFSDTYEEEEEYTEFGAYMDMFSFNMLTLDVYLTKKYKKEMYCKRITSNQVKLQDLLNMLIFTAIKIK